MTQEELAQVVRKAQEPYVAALEWIIRDAAINPPSRFNRKAQRYVAKAARALRAPKVG